MRLHWASAFALAGALTAIDLPPGWDDLGIPATTVRPAGPFARNPWDMTIIGRELALGTGNADNDSPSPNAGPVRLALWPLDTDPGTWRTVGSDGRADFPEMQIDAFLHLDGTWWITGMDPDLDWSIRTHYQLRPDGVWRQFTSVLPDKTPRWGAHAYHLMSWRGALFSAGYLIGRSTDGGQSWTVPQDARGTPEQRPRVGHLLAVGDDLYAISEPYPTPTSKHPSGCIVLQWVDEPPMFGGRLDLTPEVILPGAAWAVPGPDHVAAPIKLARSLVARGRTWYLAGLRCSDHQTATWDAFAAVSWDADATAVLRCTPAGERPWDLATVGAEVLLLTSRADGATWTVSVWSLQDDGSAKLRCRVPGLPTFARSFAIDGNDLYLGLGTDDGLPAKAGVEPISYTADLRPDSGRILRGRGMLARR